MLVFLQRFVKVGSLTLKEIKLYLQHLSYLLKPNSNKYFYPIYIIVILYYYFYSQII